MKIGTLKEILKNVDDDCEIFVSPMIYLEHQDESNEAALKSVPDPTRRYKTATAGLSAKMFGVDAGKFFLVVGFDDSKAYSLEEAVDHIETDGFIN